jgi:hypothetical protein
MQSTYQERTREGASMLCIDAESHKSSGLVELRKESRAFRIVAVLSRVTLEYATSGQGRGYINFISRLGSKGYINVEIDSCHPPTPSQ